jgi:hypothetical protein
VLIEKGSLYHTNKTKKKILKKMTADKENNLLVATLVFAVSMFIILSCSVLAETTTLTINDDLGTSQSGIVFSNNSVQDSEGSDLYYLGYFENHNGEPVMLWADNGFGGIVDFIEEQLDSPCSNIAESYYEQQSEQVVVSNQYCVLSGDLSNYITLTIIEVSEDYSSITFDWEIEEKARELSEEELLLIQENKGETVGETELLNNETVENFVEEFVEFPENKTVETEMLTTENIEDTTVVDETLTQESVEIETTTDNGPIWHYYMIIIILLSLIILLLTKLVHHEK